MGSKVYTKGGDKGKTGLIGGTRVAKYHERLEAYGTVDELNSYIGMIRSFDIDSRQKDILVKIQNKLFVIGACLATDEKKSDMKKNLPCNCDDVDYLEKEIDFMDKKLPELNSFILPGGHSLVAFCHIARTVCRRAERRIIKLSGIVNVDENLVKYINRLSDYLFMLARKLSADFDAEEIPWMSPK